MKRKKEMNILVSGASIAGMSTAYWFAKYGFKVTVIERAPHVQQLRTLNNIK